MKKIRIFIPEKSTELQEKFINYIMKKGKKSVARTIFKDTMENIRGSGQKEPEKVFEKAIENVKPVLEVRPKRIGGSVYQIPMEVTPKRQLMLTFHWILDTSRGKKGAPIAKKLAQSLIEASTGAGPAIKKKEDVHKMAESNRAFAHYAKY